MGTRAQRYLILGFAILATILLLVQIVVSLSVLRNTVEPETQLIRISLSLSAFFFPILAGWCAYYFVGGAVFTFVAAIMVFFVMSVTASPVFVWFLLGYAGLLGILFRIRQSYENQIGAMRVDGEKFQNERNDLQVAHKAKGEGISILFEKYSTYYNLRKLAEELATSLSVAELGNMIINRSCEFIAKGDVASVSLVDVEGQHYSVLNAKAVHRKDKPRVMKPETGDLFDVWVVKNQRRLIVSDSHQDFRFDVKQAAEIQSVRSLIIAPMIDARRVIGMLRIHSAEPETFSNDDLRLLDTISALSSSAISNATLYEKTEELAIKDSLTGLYVRRYFFDRLKEEHRRALLTHRQLSLLMCDLDHFKECNDKYGHGIGDLMLVRFAQILKDQLESAIAARYGGEEFSVVLPELSKEEALKVAENIRQQVENEAFTIRRQRITMTVSIGVANLPDDALDAEDLVQKADEALYRAKKSGRNRVCLSGA